MRDIGAGKREKASMNINFKRIFTSFAHAETLSGVNKSAYKFLHVIVLFLFVFSVFRCKKNAGVEQIPTGPVNLTIDLNLISNAHLNGPGSFSYFEGGIKGVLVIHDYDDNWYAFERTCAYQPYSACSRLWIDTMGIQIKCGEQLSSSFQTCCESRYMFNGIPVQGPAASRLAQYRVQRSGNLLLVYN